MPDDPRRHRLRTAALLAALCLGPGSRASAENFRGYAQVQYQRLESLRALDRSADREYWVEALQLDYAKRLKPNLSVNAQIQLTKLDYTGRLEGSRVPYGTLRLSHPNVGITGSYRLLQQTDGNGVMSRQKQAVLTGYAGRTNGPRLDWSWIRRRLDAYDRTPGSTGLTRTATLGQDIGPWSLRGGYTDLVQVSGGSGEHRISQRTWSGGSSYLYAGRAGTFSVQYDFSDSRRGGEGARVTSQAHDASVNGGKKLSSRANLSLNYAFRRARVEGPIREATDDHNGALLLSYAPSRPFSFAAGGGVRTARTELGPSTERYTLLSAGAAGPLRHGWTGGLNATHSLNWSPDGRSHRVSTCGAKTAMRLWRGMDVTGGVLASINDKMKIAPGDSLARPNLGRIVTQTTVGATAAPLHGIQFGYAYSLYRAGESLTGPANASNTGTWTVAWAPARTISFDGSRSRSTSLGPDTQRYLTSRVNAQWNASSALQLSVSYTESDSPRHPSTVQFLSARRLLTLRVLAALARDLQMNVGTNWIDPGTDRTVRQVDATITQRFSG
jgi:hypothetical protein